MERGPKKAFSYVWLDRHLNTIDAGYPFITHSITAAPGSPPLRCGRPAPWRCGAASASTAWRRWELEKVEGLVCIMYVYLYLHYNIYIYI